MTPMEFLWGEESILELVRGCLHNTAKVPNATLYVLKIYLRINLELFEENIG